MERLSSQPKQALIRPLERLLGIAATRTAADQLKHAP
jgi:ribosome-binding protein aMBF1 (putative translation factor)